MELRLQQGRFFGQFARFGITGGGVALLSIVTYWLVAVPVGWPPLLANLLSCLVSLICGFHAHRRWSFRGVQGSRARYTVVSVFAFLTNSLWVWLLTECLGSASWMPILPMLFLTPLCTFVLARFWVFGGMSRDGEAREALTLFT